MEEKSRAEERLLKRQKERAEKIKAAGIKYSLDKVGYVWTIFRLVQLLIPSLETGQSMNIVYMSIGACHLRYFYRCRGIIDQAATGGT